MRTWPALELLFGDARIVDLVQGALLDYNVAAVDEAAADRWRLFFNTPGDRQHAAEGLAKAFPRLGIEEIDIPDEDWAARSQQNLRSIRVNKLIVAPTWDVPAAKLKATKSRAQVIVIQPSMGFGTGHHPTTRLCLLALQKIELRGRRVIDVGTGSGVLAIAASMLGANQVLGIDEDADAIQAANENLPLNPDVFVTFRKGEFRATPLQGREIVLANLTGGLLIQASGHLRKLVLPGGFLVISGFTKAEEAEVTALYTDLSTAAREEEDEWVCLTLRNG